MECSTKKLKELVNEATKKKVDESHKFKYVMDFNFIATEVFYSKN